MFSAIHVHLLHYQEMVPRCKKNANLSLWQICRFSGDVRQISSDAYQLSTRTHMQMCQLNPNTCVWLR